MLYYSSKGCLPMCEPGKLYHVRDARPRSDETPEMVEGLCALTPMDGLTTQRVEWLALESDLVPVTRWYVTAVRDYESQGLYPCEDLEDAIQTANDLLRQCMGCFGDAERFDADTDEPEVWSKASDLTRRAYYSNKANHFAALIHQL